MIDASHGNELLELNQAEAGAVKTLMFELKREQVPRSFLYKPPNELTLVNGPPQPRNSRDASPLAVV